MARKYYWNII
ncbi:haloacid dehalogenase-like hydrolase family protein, partial [Chlamydia psittaci 02DC14]